MKNILILGSSGQLGQILPFLLHQPCRIYAPSSFELNLIKLSSIDQYLESIPHPDIVIYAAGYYKIFPTKNEYLDMDIIHAISPCYIYTQLEKKRPIHFVYLSTNYVFSRGHGEHLIDEQCESTLTSNHKTYADTKMNGECGLRDVFFGSSGSSMLSILRTSWVFSFRPKRMSFLNSLFTEGPKERSVVYDQVASPTFSWDLALATASIATRHHSSVVPEFYHFANSGACSMYEFSKEVYRSLGYNPRLITPISSEELYRGQQTGIPPYSPLNSKKVCKEFNIQNRSWEETVSVVASQYRRDKVWGSHVS